MSRIFGYIRVSTNEQNIDRQLDELKHFVPDTDNIIIDKTSGKTFDRPNYRALRQLSHDADIIYIKSLDRLGRNKNEIKKELEYFKSKNVVLRILDIPTTLIDFSQFKTLEKSIMEMINNILIEVLGTMAEHELHTIHQRQREGISAARLRGKHLGRPRATYPENWDMVYPKWAAKEITIGEAMAALHLKRTTFYNLAKKTKNGTRT